MAYSIFITAHGGRDAGTSKGTYLVPPGVNVHCFTGDAVLLKGNIGMAIEDRLTAPALNIDVVNNSVTKTYTAFELMPNYTAFGSNHADPAFLFDTGVYYVGSQKNDPPSLAIGDGVQIQLGDVIAQYRRNFPDLTDVYWLCCRAAPQNSNNPVDVDDGAYGLIEKPSDMGLKPSKVKQSGVWR